MSETKIILDACCGSRMFWFFENKNAKWKKRVKRRN